MNARTSSVQTYDEYRNNNYFTALDGLRGISILLVLLHHVPRFDSWLLAVLGENGRYGVSFFFVISGFLICSLLLREEAKTGRISLGKFYGRRALRLLPLYYVVLTMEVVLIYGFNQYTPENQALFREKLPSYLFYYSNWLPTATQGPFFCSWSLAVEEQFYLTFGFLLLVVPRRWLLALVSGALITKFFVYQTIGSVDATSTAWRIAFSYQESILWGVLLAFGLHHRAFYERFARLLRSAWIVAGCAVLALTWLLTHPMETSSTWDAELLYVLMTAIVAGLVMRRSVPLLSGGLIAHVGKVSYGIYLLHMFVINAVKKLPHGMDPAVCFALSTVVVIIAASIVYRYFELPIISYYKRRFAPTAERKPVPAGMPSTRPAI